MVIMNVIKILYNVSHIIWYKLHNAWLHMIDVELPIPSLFNPLDSTNRSTMKSNHTDSTNQYETFTIDDNDDLVNDYIDSWYEVDSTNQKDKPLDSTNQYDGPYCETP